MSIERCFIGTPFPFSLGLILLRILGHDYSLHDYPIIMTLVLYSGFQVMIIVFRIQVMIISDLVLINMTLVFLLSSLVVLVSLWYVARIHYNNPLMFT